MRWRVNCRDAPPLKPADELAEDPEPWENKSHMHVEKFKNESNVYSDAIAFWYLVRF